MDDKPRRSTRKKISPSALNCNNVPSQDDIRMMQEEKSKNYPSITTAMNHDDAAKYSFKQLEWMRDNDITSFGLLDFVHMSDQIISKLFLNKKDDPLFGTLLEFPLTTRRNVSVVKKHIIHTKYRNNPQIKKEENDSELFLLEHLSQHPKYKCMGISKKIFLGSAGVSENNEYQDNLTEGYHSLCQQAIMNMAHELSNGGSPDEKLFGKHGFVHESERDKDRGRLFLCYKENKNFLLTKDKYDQYAFHHEKCSGFLEEGSKDTICKSCHSKLHSFRKKCTAKGSSERKCNLNSLMNSSIYHSTSSPEKAKVVITEMNRRNNNLRNQKYRLGIKYDSLLNRTGVDISLEQSNTLFNNETKELYNKFLSEDTSSVSQSELIKYICCKSWENAETARLKGKKNVRYCPIIIKFASYLKSKTGNSGYSFLSNVFTLPSCRTVDRYATLDSNAQDGILYDTLDDMKQSLDLLLKTEHANSSQERKDWACKGVLKFDEMKVKEKIVFNPHTNEIIGFVDGGIDVDVLKKEMIDMSNDEAAGKNKKNLPPIAKHFLLFMFCRWDNFGNPMKRSVARYSVSNSTGEGLARKIIPIISALFTRGFIVNQVTCDGASENVSAMKQLGTITAEEAFPDLVRNTKLPKDIKVGFYHPIRRDVVVYIGGEMPHWVKKFVNAMENSSKENSKRDLTYRNCKINLGMIHHVWASHQSQINSLQVIRKLTEDHFVKNPHSRMRVYLATQVLSNNVLQMIEDYCGNNEEEKQRYSSLLLCVKYIDTLVDIWNHPFDKKFKRDPEGNTYECITSGNHEYIKYLEEILEFFSDWDNESRNKEEDLYKFIPKTLFESFTWLVYGLKGVASQIPKGCAMVQRRGGTDDVEHEFSYIRHKNPNPSIADARGMVGQQTNFRATNFAKNVRTNTSGDKQIHIDELREVKKRKT